MHGALLCRDSVPLLPARCIAAYFLLSRHHILTTLLLLLQLQPSPCGTPIRPLPLRHPPDLCIPNDCLLHRLCAITPRHFYSVLRHFQLVPHCVILVLHRPPQQSLCHLRCCIVRDWRLPHVSCCEHLHQQSVIRTPNIFATHGSALSIMSATLHISSFVATFTPLHPPAFLAWPHLCAPTPLPRSPMGATICCTAHLDIPLLSPRCRLTACMLTVHCVSANLPRPGPLSPHHTLISGTPCTILGLSSSLRM